MHWRHSLRQTRVHRWSSWHFLVKFIAIGASQRSIIEYPSTSWELWMQMLQIWVFMIFASYTFSNEGDRMQFSKGWICFMTDTVALFDHIQTNLMSQMVNAKLYKGMSNCFLKNVREEGPLSLWSRFTPIWMRLSPMATMHHLSIEICILHLDLRVFEVHGLRSWPIICWLCLS